MAKIQQQLRQYRVMEDLHCQVKDGNLRTLLQHQAAMGQQLRGDHGSRLNPASSSSGGISVEGGAMSMDECAQLTLALALAPDDTLPAAERNGWEVRRLLAARSSRGLSGERERWMVALRLFNQSKPHHIGGPVTVAEVLRARSELMLRVHPDKCNSSIAKQAAEAFSYLQEASSGLLKELSAQQEIKVKTSD